jgi:pimeloyl-ACP methyl ester carboxylesterase
LMSVDAHETAPMRFVGANSIRYPYRRFGRGSGLPILLLNYFAATMDDWDPKVTNGLAAEQEVILFDNAGVGWRRNSSSQALKRLAGWASPGLPRLSPRSPTRSSPRRAEG